MNARYRVAILNGKVFSLREAGSRGNDLLERSLTFGSKIERAQRLDTTFRPHNALGHRPQALGMIIPVDDRPIMH
ncbi:MAG: hypothetical protein AAF355_16180 [Myxococcota bacterium]